LHEGIFLFLITAQYGVWYFFAFNIALATTVHGNELIKFREIFEGTYPHFNKESVMGTMIF
jgi:hypothetical protein